MTEKSKNRRKCYGGARRGGYGGRGFRLTPRTLPIYLLLLLLLWSTDKLAPAYFSSAPSDAGEPAAMLSEAESDAAAKGGGEEQAVSDRGTAIDPAALPEYSGSAYIILENNVPRFPEEDKDARYSFEEYAELDALGRCGPAYANIGLDLMPTARRGEIGGIRPSGWKNVKYEGLVEGNYLYNRCHLIAYQLSGENANAENLITGTRAMNTEMIPFENEVADYVRTTGNHVLYRVSPLFQGDNLLASGVTMEAWSVEDQGEGVCYFVYLYNVQPGIEIDYATGESRCAA